MYVFLSEQSMTFNWSLKYTEIGFSSKKSNRILKSFKYNSYAVG